MLPAKFSRDYDRNPSIFIILGVLGAIDTPPKTYKVVRGTLSLQILNNKIKILLVLDPFKMNNLIKSI